MKVAPVSADLLIKLSLMAAAVAGVVLLARRAGDALPSFSTFGQSFNPTSSQNLAYTGVNALGNAIVDATGPGRNGDGSWTLGGFIYDVTHADPFTPIAPAAPAAPAYVPPSTVQDDYGTPIYPYA